jgi:hypothetical protein
VFVRGARAFSLYSFKKHTSSFKNISIVLQKIIIKAPACFSTEPPFPRASDETRFLKKTKATKRNLLAGFLAQPRPPGASLNSNMMLKLEF